MTGPGDATALGDMTAPGDVTPPSDPTAPGDAAALILDWPAACAAGPARAGGKGHQLAVLATLGIPVPPGFAIDAAASAAHRPGAAAPAALAAQLAQELQRRGWADQPLAVRSSAAAEDSATASFAGILRSCLNVRGLPAVLGGARGLGLAVVARGAGV